MPDLICIEKCRNGLENCIGDALVILAGPAQAGLELECLQLSQLEQFPYAAVSPDVIVEEVILENPLEIDVVGDPPVLQAILRVARAPISSKPRGTLGSSQCGGRARTFHLSQALEAHSDARPPSDASSQARH